MEFSVLTFEGDADDGLVSRALFDFEGLQLDVVLNDLLGELPPDEPLRVVDSVRGIPGVLVLGCVSKESLLRVEGNIGGCGVVALFVGDDLDLVVESDTHSGVGGAQFNAHGGFHAQIALRLLQCAY